MDTDTSETDETEMVPEAVIEPPPKQDLRKTWIIAGAATVIALAAAMVGVKALDKNDNTPVAAANAAQNGATLQRPTAGKITAIDGSSFTVKATDFDGSTTNVKVSTSDDTTYVDSVEGTVSDLKKGDNVIATGTTADGVLTATRISQAPMMRLSGDGPQTFSQGGPPPGNGTPPGDGDIVTNGDAAGGGNFAGGEITNIDGNTITVTNPAGGATTVKVTDATKVIVDKTIKFKDLKVGDTVRVTGTTSGDTVKAEQVTRGDLDGGFFGGGPARRTIVTTPAS